MPAGTEHPGNSYHALAYGDSVDVWWPFSFAGDSNRRGSHFVEGIGRLKDGVSVAQARSEMNVIMTQLGREHPDNDASWSVLVVPALHGDCWGQPADAACAAGSRGHRAADRLRECGQSAAGASLGTAARDRRAAGHGRSALARCAPTADGEPSYFICRWRRWAWPSPSAASRSSSSCCLPDFPGRTIFTSAHLCSRSRFLSACSPGFFLDWHPRYRLHELIREKGLQKGGRTSTSGRHQNRLRHALVVSEISLACVLLIGAGLMLRSFLNLLHLDPGFQQEHVLTASLSLPQSQVQSHYNTGELTARFYDQLTTNLNALARTSRARARAAICPGPATTRMQVASSSKAKSHRRMQEFHARYHMATPGYFSALGHSASRRPLLHRGRQERCALGAYHQPRDGQSSIGRMKM